MEENDRTPPSEEMQSLTVIPSASSSSNPTTLQSLSLEERFQLVRSVGEECIQEDMLPGLQQGQEKMSKSDPSSSIFMEDEEVEVKTKIKKAYCPPQIVEGNPCLEYIKHIVFPWFNKFKVERNPENGGEKIYESFEELVSDYESGGLHPGDLKPALAKALNKILQPVRDHFSKDPKAKDLLKRVKGYRVTR